MSEPDRPTRQHLVVPPQQSSLPMIIGACACACAGFGLVWGLGIGRTRPGVDEPAAFPPPDVELAQTAPADGWRSPPPRGASATDRYPNRPVSLDREDAGEVVPAAAESRPLSRFSSAPDELPAGEAPDGEAPEDTSPTPAAGPTSAPAADQATDADVEDNAPVALPAEAAATASATPPTEAAADDAEQAAPFDEPADEPLSEPLAAQPAPVAAPVTAAPAPAAASAPPQPFAPPPAPHPVAAAPVGSAFAAPPPQLAAASASSPPLPAAAFGVPPLSAPLPPQPSPTVNGATGQGRPGPMQLEGVQTPQLSVEKRGPREVQVGKPARYEIVVRNVGSAVAHDVILRDAVPAGTALVTTTPPATPGSGPGGEAATGELVWMLGVLGPGNETKVAMEVMPEAEGEIGSVASVTFRADASLRSRATKPALAVDIAAPKPVLIGKTINLAVKITNPGTGVATGVVLEGVLPEGVTHRAGRELEFDVGQLRPGETRTIDLTLATSGPGVHAMRITARGDGRIEAEQSVPLEVTAPMLEVAADMPARRYLQRPATCRITMSNTGTAPAKAVELATQLPPGMKFVRANNAGYYDERTHRVLWSLEELPAGEAGTVELVVMPIQLGPQKFVTAARNPDGLSDQAANTIEVEGLAALTFEVADSEDPIELDGVTEYVIRVGNQGTKAASGVRVAASLLGQMEPVEAKGPASHRVENLTVLFEPLARLAPSEEAVFRVRARGRSEGDQRLQVQVTSDDHPAPITKEEITRVYADR